ncbi:MAG: carbohydrate kinase, partial [Acidobacteria bacterium]|nr:carbohydrate kinase [Acidobacteriota bacterium]
VIAGPVEATAAGNAVMQLIALGELGSIEEGRAVIRRSFHTEAYEPRDTHRWEDTYRGFLKLMQHPAVSA